VLHHGDTHRSVARGWRPVLAAGAVGRGSPALLLSVSGTARSTAWLRHADGTSICWPWGRVRPNPVGEAVTPGGAGRARRPAALPTQAAEIRRLGRSVRTVALVALWLVDWRAGVVFTLLSPLTALVWRGRFITEAGDGRGPLPGPAQTGMAALPGERAGRGPHDPGGRHPWPVETERVVAPLPETVRPRAMRSGASSGAPSGRSGC